ncbi:MAG: DNA-protecting protein DprA [Ignavibacteria bacterium]|nr:DNA-processing protein DprA [Ignavibacteria bacterium]MCC7158506.1 DNA-protecting protein DprA [Ignavibacteria bacterium]
MKYLFYLTKVEGLGSVRIKRLLERFGGAEMVFNASVKEMSQVENISEKTAEAIISAGSNLNELEQQYDELIQKTEKLKIGIVSLIDDDYPDLLKRIYDPPIIFYTRGKYNNDLLVNSVGIVGTRKPTDYGKKMAEMFSRELSSLGIAVISGFARGVDTISHKAVLGNAASKAITAAVFGCGVDNIYPPENKKLYDEMIERGLLISEYEISAIPDAINFPKRNRIISGLSLGTIVIESDVDGGALITSRTALDQSREVFAVPGYVTSRQSRGTNALIKNGHAKLIENTDDVLDEIKNKLQNINISVNGKSGLEPKIILELKGNEKAIYDAFLRQSEPLHIDSISEISGLNISDSLVSLLNLEFKGVVDQLPGKRFKIK